MIYEYFKDHEKAEDGKEEKKDGDLEISSASYCDYACDFYKDPEALREAKMRGLLDEEEVKRGGWTEVHNGVGEVWTG